MSVSNEEIGALLRRADALKDQDVIPDGTRSFWRGYAKALRDLQSGGGKKAAAKDSAAQQIASVPGAARAGLPKDREGFCVSDVQEVFAADRLQIAGHLVADFEVNGVQQLENGKLTAVVLNCKQPSAVVDANDRSTSHDPSCFVGTSMGQEPAPVCGGDAA